MTYLLVLLLTVVLGNEAEGHSVQSAGHHTKQGTHSQGGVDVREKSNQSRPQAK